MIGDLLVVIRGNGAQPHYGIDWGRGYVAHVEAGGCAEVVSLARFSRGFAVVVARVAAVHEVPGIIARAESLLGQPYYLVTFNCESFVSYALTGQLRSWTVDGLVTLGVIFAIGVAAVKAFRAV